MCQQRIAVDTRRCRLASLLSERNYYLFTRLGGKVLFEDNVGVLNRTNRSGRRKLSPRTRSNVPCGILSFVAQNAELRWNHLYRHSL